MDRRDFLIGTSGILVGTGLTKGYDHITNNNKNNNNGSMSIKTGDSPKIGSSEASVKLVYWVDFQCPYCYRFSNNQYPQIKENYIDENQVQMILKPLTIFGEDSQKAAESMHCVNDVKSSSVPSWYKTLHNMYNNSSGRNTGWASQNNLLNQANSEIQINSSEFEDCLVNTSYLNQLQTDYQEGKNFGLSGTPFFVLYNENNQKDYKTINGAQRYRLFSSRIDGKL